MQEIDDTLTLEETCAVIGYENTRLVAAWFAGRVLWVPASYRPEHPLVVLLGERAVRQLIEAYGGQRIGVPVSREDSRHRQDRAVAEMIAGGASVEAIAAFLELSVRRAEQIRSELEARGILAYAGGYRRRPRGRPAEGARATPDLMTRDSSS
nr:hypothetical protein [Ralstonia sp.]